MSNILKFFFAGQFKPKGPHEFAGPCPACGGNDRFIVWPDRERGGAFLCRGCAAQGDGIEFLRRFMGMTYREACEALTLPPSNKGQTAMTCHQLRPVPKPVPVATMPPGEWIQQASNFLRLCQSDLETNTAAVLALTAGGLTPDTALACGLGWNPVDRYERRAAWGLSVLPGKDRMVLPAGLVIATRRKSGPVALTIRTVDPERPKYWEVAGSGKNFPYVIGKPGLPVVLLESALDAALLYQEAGDLCAAAAFMGNTKGVDANTDAFIKTALAVIAAPDNDKGGKAAWQKWKAAYPAAVCAPAVGAKDIGDMHKAALGLQPVPTAREWAEFALHIARKNALTGRESDVSGKSDTTYTLAQKKAQEAA